MTDETAAHPDCTQFAHPHLGPCTPAAKPPGAETLTPMARAWLERFTPESWEGFPGYEPEIATAIRQALTAIDAANAEIERLRNGAFVADTELREWTEHKCYEASVTDTNGIAIVKDSCRGNVAEHGALKRFAAAQRELGELRAKYDEEVREFNAGYAAFETGIACDDEPPGMKHDQWHAGWAWAAHKCGAAARVAALEAEHEQLRQMVLTQGETIHEQEERIEALAAALAKAGEAIHSEYCGSRHHAECIAVDAALAGLSGKGKGE